MIKKFLLSNKLQSKNILSAQNHITQFLLEEMSLKDFEIITKLGAYSSVYKVKRHVDGEVYALKKVKMNNLSEKEQENALNEVRILASVKSPYIVGYKHAFIEANSLCIVMEFSDDGDLYQKIVQHQKQHKTFDEEMIWRTLIQVTIGLKNLHQLNILHRDLKSANVFLSKNGVAKLGDMNVSKIAKNGLLYTQTGTPYYASPEVWKDKPYDSKSDIWSLGCVIYEMTTLKPPFRAEDMDGLYKKVTKGSYQKIPQNFSKTLGSAIKSMLQVNPSNRPTAAQLLKSLASKAQQYDITTGNQQQLNKQLLQTIRVNKNLHYLTDRLPNSNYNNGHQYEKVPKMNQSTKSKNYSQPSAIIPSRINNLPKLDRVIIKNNNNHRSPTGIYQSISQNERKRIDVASMLKIEGKSNNSPKYEYSYDNPKKTLERDLKAELRRLYNIKQSPTKQKQIKPLRRNIDLPRIK